MEIIEKLRGAFWARVINWIFICVEITFEVMQLNQSQCLVAQTNKIK